jgi:hypothetical protein
MFSRPFRDRLVFVEPTQEYALGLPLLSQNLHDMPVGTTWYGCFLSQRPSVRVWSKRTQGLKPKSILNAYGTTKVVP